ncbi:SUKH-4 family immunity protein [Streptomyces sp. MT29]|nr:SUKH-4 family immunity protein [Streptomyces sp. MT29]
MTTINPSHAICVTRGIKNILRISLPTMVRRRSFRFSLLLQDDSMAYAVAPHEMIRRFGLAGVVYVPLSTGCLPLPGRTAGLLSFVGLPHGDDFMSRTEGDPIQLSERFAERDGVVPQKCRDWLELDWLQHMVVAIDPAEGAVYAFPEGAPLDSYVKLHRDVESLVYTFLAYGDFLETCGRRDNLDEAELHFKQKVSEFDQIPFAHEASEWSRIVEDIVEENWSA